MLLLHRSSTLPPASSCFLDQAGAPLTCATARPLLSVEGAQRAHRSGGQLALVRGSRRVNRVFALTGLCDVLEIVDLDPSEPPVQALLKFCGTWDAA